MVACWNWIRDFVQTSYRQTQCANNGNTHNRVRIAEKEVTVIYKRSNAANRTHQLWDNIVIAFLCCSQQIFFSCQKIQLFVVCVFFFYLQAFCLLVGFGCRWHQKIAFYIFTCSFIWHFFWRNTWIDENYVSIIMVLNENHNSLFMEHWAMT